MQLLYNIILQLYWLLIKLSSFSNKKAKLWIDGRKNWRKLLLQKRNNNEEWIWFHCSSLGEYEDSCEIFIQIKNDNPDKKTLLTFFSPSGYEVLKKETSYDLVMYMPIDTPKNAKFFLDILKPQSVFFSRSDLWLNFILEIKKREIPFFLLSLRLTTNSNFFIWPANHHFNKCFKGISHIYCQNEITKNLLKTRFNIDNASITGNPRFDRIYKESLNFKEVLYIPEFVKDSFVIVAGSCLLEEEKKILKIYKKLESCKIKWIIVPHSIDINNIEKTIKKNPDKIIRYSNIKSLSKSHSILYFDSVGFLKYLYKYANLAMIGGGFNRIGIHNIIEPSVYGVKTLFGPNYREYDEANYLISIKGSEVFHNAEESLTLIRHEYDSMGDETIKKKIIKYVEANTGAGNKIIKSIKALCPGLI
jgi:3-deoxy-D-manno-octulosonic-acid transferase